MNISISANSLLISLVLFVHAAVATLSNEAAPTVKLPSGDCGTRAAVQIHNTSVLFVLFMRSVGSIVAEHPYGAMPSACEKTWVCTDCAHRGRDLLKAAREENGAFCAYVRVASPRLRRTADGRIVAVGGGSDGWRKRRRRLLEARGVVSIPFESQILAVQGTNSRRREMKAQLTQAVNTICGGISSRCPVCPDVMISQNGPWFSLGSTHSSSLEPGHPKWLEGGRC